MSDPVPARLLYPGSGGHLGRRVVKLLMEAGDSNITASSRSPQKLSRFAAKVKADFNDPTTLAAAFAGVERLLIISIDGLGDIILSNNSVFG
jgi:NAD(P)H dehydrogenase (quinone)